MRRGQNSFLNDTDAVADLVDDELPVDRVTNRLSYGFLLKDWTRQIEIEMVVDVAGLTNDLDAGNRFNPIVIGAAERIPQVDLVRHQLRNGGVAIWNDLVDDLFELRFAAPVALVGRQFNVIAPLPIHIRERPDSDGLTVIWDVVDVRKVFEKMLR